MVIGGAKHPYLLATLKRQVENVFKAKALPPARQPKTLHVTGPFTLGRTLCDPYKFAEKADLFPAGVPENVDAAAADVSSHCEGPFFVGSRGDGTQPERQAAQAPWAATFAANSPFEFRFDGCKGHWHRPGSRMHYPTVLAAMNVTHHLKITAR